MYIETIEVEQRNLMQAKTLNQKHKEEFDKLVEWTTKNWWKTGNCTKANAATGSIDRPFKSSKDIARAN
jgi:hypothetical protein